MASYNLSNEGLDELNTLFLTKSYVSGFQASQDDLAVFNAMNRAPEADKHPHLARWFNHISALIASRFPGEATGVKVGRGAGGAAKQGESKKDKAKAKAAAAKPAELSAEEKQKQADEKLAAAKAKLHSKCVKEGGKKGIEIAGAADMGGLDYFCTTLCESSGDLDLLQVSLDAMNKEIDPADEESKGGSGEVGKMVFSAGVDQLAVYAYAPASKDKIDCEAWIKAVSEDCDKVEWVVQGTPNSKLAAMTMAKKDGFFPIKVKDDAMTAAFKYLRANDAFPEDDGDDEDDYCYGDDAFDDI